MTYQGAPGPLPQAPVYFVGMQPGHNAVSPGFPPPAAPPPYSQPPAPVVPQPPGPIVPQPPAPVLMPTPGRPAGCPPGLEYLSQIDQLLVQQRVNWAEMITGWEMNNCYTVKNNLGQQVFVATEQNDIITMQVCGSSRPFTIHIHDNIGQEVLSLTRPLRCSACCFPCCLQELEVQSPPGNPIGFMEQDWHPLLPKFTIMDELRKPQLKIRGPFCDCNCMSDVIFEVMSLDESAVVGQISKQWGGFLHEAFTDADNFGISFPMDLDVKIKAVMLGACFLIDFMFFENKPHND